MSGFDRVRNVEIGHKNIKVLIFKRRQTLTFTVAEALGGSVHDGALDRQNLPREKALQQVAQVEPQTDAAEEKDKSSAQRSQGGPEHDHSSRQGRQYETESFI